MSLLRGQAFFWPCMTICFIDNFMWKVFFFIIVYFLVILIALVFSLQNLGYLWSLKSSGCGGGFD